MYFLWSGCGRLGTFPNFSVDPRESFVTQCPRQLPRIKLAGNDLHQLNVLSLKHYFVVTEIRNKDMLP